MDKTSFKISFYIYFPALLLLVSTALFSQHNYFTDAGANKNMILNATRVIEPRAFRSSVLNKEALHDFLWSLPDERSAISSRNHLPVLELPMPDGSTARFRVWESSIQEPGLAERFSQIKTFNGQGIDDPAATIRFDWGPNGFHAQVLTINGTFYIDPYAPGNTDYYISYYKNDLGPDGSFHCFNTGNTAEQGSTGRISAACRGTELRTYRLAVACTGEYAQSPGINAGNDPAKLHNAIVTTVNRVVGVLEKEVSVRLVLVNNNSNVEFLNAAADPFTANFDASSLINESQAVIDSRIGFSNYDIGHTFSSGAGGLAWMGCVCSNIKAKGVTGRSNPTGDAYDIDYVAHEIGHQLGGDHTFNSITSNCGAAWNAATAYEAGSGTTIQAYAGICGSDNIQPHSDPYYHAVSFDQISNFLSNGGANCGINTPTGNQLPVINQLPNNNLTIPAGTPFTITGSATDPDGDALTYCWEEWDLGTAGAWNNGANSTTAPLFKSRVPVTNGSRTFPDTGVIYANYPALPSPVMNGMKGETLPKVARTLKFRLTVRDNRAGGGGVVSSGGGCQSASPFVVKVAGTTSFTVIFPNGGGSFTAGSTQTITWNNAGTNAAPFNVTNVKILLSADGGASYPYIIKASTPNDGTETVTIPVMPFTAKARIKIEALGNIFFDVSNNNFTIVPGVLPVILSAFKGSLQGTDALLQWTTASEHNSHHFELERSPDGTQFQRIAVLSAAGESQSALHYTYTDRTMLQAKNYYRLKLVDTDGSAVYSQVLLLSLYKIPASLQLNASLTADGLVLRFSGQTTGGIVRLFDMNAKMILSGNIPAGNQQTVIAIQKEKIPKGVYIVQVLLNEQQLTTKVIQQ